MRVRQRDITIVNFQLDENDFQEHPVLILSNDDIINNEAFFTVVMLSTTPHEDDYTFLLENDMFNFEFKPQLKTPYHKPQIRCNLIGVISKKEIVNRMGSMKKEYFCQAVEHIKTIVFSCE